MTNGKITYEDLERWGACDRDEGKRYSRAVLDSRYGAGWSLALREVLEDDRIPAVDRAWVATRREVLSEEQTAAWLDIVVTRVVRKHALRCGVPAVEEWAARWLSGENRSLDAARAVVAAAAWSAAWSAAAAATWSAAWSAADGAWSWAADAAAWSAAWSARAAEREQQCADLLGILRDGEGVR